MINFSSNDYLGLSAHPKLIERSQTYLQYYGTGSTASRLVCGTYDIHEQLEEKLASAYQREAALVFNTGFQANSTIVSALTNRKSVILSDKLSHNSLLQGAMLSRATFRRFRHSDMDHLEQQLQKAKSENFDRILIITETIFSMDGDRSDVDLLIELADKHNALLYVDDAHAVGVWGENGYGLTTGKTGIDLMIGTFGKAYGSFGAFVACSREMKDYLINFCPGFIYTTALPPAVIGSIEAAVELIPQLKDDRTYLHQQSRSLKKKLQNMGFNTDPSTTQIIPITIGEEEKTIQLSEWLEQNGILATAIRPPTVEKDKSRIRITLSSKHKPEHIEHFLNVLNQWNESES